MIIERLKNLYAQDKYDDSNERCWDCENWELYCFDEYDADAWCELSLDVNVKYCSKFKKCEE